MGLFINLFQTVYGNSHVTRPTNRRKNRAVQLGVMCRGVRRHFEGTDYRL